ncbi:MAG: SDR family oxidoreductase, partial [Methylacidiphilales bacterium]|nr:SDR family oxidoreductase [Candidatus Methylacidiphilales bacterium]
GGGGPGAGGDGRTRAADAAGQFSLGIRARRDRHAGARPLRAPACGQSHRPGVPRRGLRPPAARRLRRLRDQCPRPAGVAADAALRLLHAGQVGAVDGDPHHAQALAPRIRVNAVGPGPTLANPRQSEDDFARQAAAIPLGRAATPSEIASAVLYLAEARSVTGQMIAVDGGQHLAWRTPDIEGIAE